MGPHQATLKRMSLRIGQDHARFKKIVRGQVRDNLRKYISKGELIGKHGKEVVSIPVPRVDIPRLRFTDQQQGGVAQGDGKAGDSLGKGKSKPGSGKAGEQAGEHIMEAEISMSELADILGEELELPNIEPKGRNEIVQRKDRYRGIRRVGPNALMHFKRSYRQALRRQIAMGSYDPTRPVIIPVREDLRFKSWKTDETTATNAAIIYMMDVSGSMGDEQKETVRIESFWIDTWLRRQYKGVETRFIIHDATAREVDRDTFFRTRESGGTMISSAYKLAAQMVAHSYPAQEWNIYPFHFSDGDNWSAEDTRLCIKVLQDQLLPSSNVFCYGQVESPYGSGQFIKDLREHLGADERLITSDIPNRDAVADSIKLFLGKGK